MSIHVADVIDLICSLPRINNLKVTVRESVKGGLLAGSITVVGGLLAGPVGLAIGGAVGGLTAAATAKKFESVASVLTNMNNQQKQKLAGSVTRIIARYAISDPAILVTFVLANTAIYNEIVDVVSQFVKNELGLNFCEN